MPNYTVCLSPDLLYLYEVRNTVIVISDILRATSSITAGIGSGIQRIYPVGNIQACKELGYKGYITAGERDGIKIPEFDLGNSPFDFMDEKLRGKSVAMTTTNGTRAIASAKDATKIIIGSFLNLSAVVNYLNNQDLNIIVLASGWRGRLSIEDTLLGGAIAERLDSKYKVDQGDEVLCATELWKNAKPDLPKFMTKLGHYRRLQQQHKIARDLELCVSVDKFDVLPILKDHELVKL